MRANVVLKKVCEALGVRRTDLISNDRNRTLVDARFISYLMLIEHSGLNQSDIARKMRRDPSTVCNGVKTAEALKEVDVSFQLKYITVERIINQSIESYERTKKKA